MDTTDTLILATRVQSRRRSLLLLPSYDTYFSSIILNVSNLPKVDLPRFKMMEKKIFILFCHVLIKKNVWRESFSDAGRCKNDVRFRGVGSQANLHGLHLRGGFIPYI